MHNLLHLGSCNPSALSDVVLSPSPYEQLTCNLHKHTFWGCLSDLGCAAERTQGTGGALCLRMGLMQPCLSCINAVKCNSQYHKGEIIFHQLMDKSPLTIKSFNHQFSLRYYYCHNYY